MKPASRRIDAIDALRGFALAGILLVNIQSFAWGAGNPLGYFPSPPAPHEQLLFLVLAVAVAGKFYAIFALLFGAGFAMQLRRMRRLSGSRARASGMYARRVAFLAVVGLLHGTLLYFGDILTTYAACAALLLPFAWLRAAGWARLTRRLWLLAAAILAVLAASSAVPVPPGEEGEVPDVAAIPAAQRTAFAIYAHEGYAAQLPRRVEDDLDQAIGSIPTAWPQVLALFALGTLAGRLGWLRHPERFARVWRIAWFVGLGVGLPAALAAGVAHLAAIRDRPGAEGGIDGWLLDLSTLLSFAYVAAFVRWRAAAPMRAAMRWLAPAGRMPLTNYLLQSVAMGVLLSGWGLGWAASATRARLAALALAIYAAQLVASRAWLAFRPQGPVEAVWRRFTYGAAA